jgi:hypothetical protein
VNLHVQRVPESVLSPGYRLVSATYPLSGRIIGDVRVESTVTVHEVTELLLPKWGLPMAEGSSSHIHFWKILIGARVLKIPDSRLPISEAFPKFSALCDIGSRPSDVASNATTLGWGGVPTSQDSVIAKGNSPATKSDIGALALQPDSEVQKEEMDHASASSSTLPAPPNHPADVVDDADLRPTLKRLKTASTPF